MAIAPSPSQEYTNSSTVNGRNIYGAEKDLSWYLPLYKAALRRNLESAKKLFDKDKGPLEGEMDERHRKCMHKQGSTVVFAAAITVPGGNKDDNGLPVFGEEKAFIVFTVSDRISLFTSSASLLMFLLILTLRYVENDFLYVLPKRLIIRLFTLFVSITTMVVFGQKTGWVLIVVCLQFPLLVDLISSTYGPGIFGKQSEGPFY